MRVSVVAGLLCVWLAPLAVHADAVAGPPACPPGSRARSSHEGQWCEASACTDDSACDEGSRCRPWRVCTQIAMVEPGGLRARDEPAAPREMVMGTCDVSAACRGTEEPPPPIVGVLEGRPRCVDGTFCLPPSLPAFPSGPIVRGSSAPPPPPETARATVPTPPPAATAPTPAPASCPCGIASRVDGRAGASSFVMGLACVLTLSRRRSRRSA